MNEAVEVRNILRRYYQNNKPRVPRTDFSTTKKMQNPPLLMPNYGKRKSTPGVPKTKVSRVLLYDNVTQQHMLDVKRAHIKIEKERIERLFDLHIRSFTARSAMRRRRLSTFAMKSYGRPETSLPTFYNRDKNMSDYERDTSAEVLEKLKLPMLEPSKKEIVLDLKTKSGKHRRYYSSDENGLFLNLFPLHKFYPDVTRDPRFTQLESLLVSTK